MMRIDGRGKAAAGCMVVSILVVVAGCGSGSTGSASSGTSMLIDRSSSALGITGSPPTSAKVGQTYTFQPDVSATGSSSSITDLKFSIQNSPAWARFDASTGKLSGTPNSTQVGSYDNVRISVQAGNTSKSLAPFSIVVVPANPGNVTLSWQPPAENADGSPLIDLKGYKLHYGPSSRAYANTIQVPNPGLTTYVVENLPSGKYYFAISTYNSAGVESSPSVEVSTQVD